jgi:hypothetical protein
MSGEPALNIAHDRALPGGPPTGPCRGRADAPRRRCRLGASGRGGLRRLPPISGGRSTPRRRLRAVRCPGGADEPRQVPEAREDLRAELHEAQRHGELHCRSNPLDVVVGQLHCGEDAHVVGELVSSIQQRMTQVADRVEARPRPRVAVLEWTDPPVAPRALDPGDGLVGRGRSGDRRRWRGVSADLVGRRESRAARCEGGRGVRLRQAGHDRFTPRPGQSRCFTPGGSGRCGGCERVVGAAGHPAG